MLANPWSTSGNIYLSKAIIFVYRQFSLTIIKGFTYDRLSPRDIAHFVPDKSFIIACFKNFS